MQDVVNLISTLGFPIVVAVGLAYFIYQAFLKITDENKAREAKLYEMISVNQKQVKKAIEVNASFVEVLNDFNEEFSQVHTDINQIQEDIKDIKKDLDTKKPYSGI